MPTTRPRLAVTETPSEAQRREAITATSGALSGLFGDGYLEELREDWPA